MEMEGTHKAMDTKSGNAASPAPIPASAPAPALPRTGAGSISTGAGGTRRSGEKEAAAPWHFGRWRS